MQTSPSRLLVLALLLLLMGVPAAAQQPAADHAALSKKILALVPERQKDGEHGPGKAVFAKLCAACHTVDGPSKVGPTLQGIGRRADAAGILESIVDPSKQITPGFVAEAVETDEDTLVGFVMEHGNMLHLTVAAGEPVMLDKKEVKSRRVLASSLMPAGLEKTMSDVELADLVAYLTTLNVGGPDAVVTVPTGPTLTLAKNDRIVILGNTFAERMGAFSHFEAALTAKYPDYNLTFRNMGWSGDSLTIQDRPFKFGEMPEHLAAVKADVIFACFGMTESFDGPAGLSKFEADLAEYAKKMLSAKFNGRTAPRLVLVSPIAHEQIDGLPDPSEHNKSLEAYTAAMRKFAEAQRLPFVDLFTPTAALMAQPGKAKLTTNGIHLTDYGYWVVSRAMMQALFPKDVQPWHFELAAAAAADKLQIQATGFPAVTPLPKGVKAEQAHFDFGPTLAVKGLKPGRYALKSAGQTVAVADAAAWEKGVGIPDSQLQQVVEKLRDSIDEKNQNFFHRWRAVNGEYIYGRRKAPFGIVNFPPEMQQWEEIVAKLDAYIASQAKIPATQQFELAPE